MNQAEVVVQRRNTAAFIEADPSDLRFERFEPRRNGAGGLTMESAGFTDVQRVRFMRGKLPTNRPGPQNTTAGFIERRYDRVIARHDADMKAGDVFLFEGEHWKITKVLPKEYQLTAHVELRGDG